MGAMASQISSLTIVYSTVYSAADQRKHQSFASLAFVLGIHRWPVNSPHKWPVTRKMFPFDDVIMQSITVATNINKYQYVSMHRLWWQWFSHIHYLPVPSQAGHHSYVRNDGCIPSTYFRRSCDTRSPVDGPLGPLSAINRNKKLLIRRNEHFTQFHAPHFRLSLIALPHETNTSNESLSVFVNENGMVKESNHTYPKWDCCSTFSFCSVVIISLTILASHFPRIVLYILGSWSNLMQKHYFSHGRI